MSWSLTDKIDSANRTPRLFYFLTFFFLSHGLAGLSVHLSLHLPSAFQYNLQP